MCDSGVSPLLWWEERSAEQAQTPGSWLSSQRFWQSVGSG